MSNSTLTVGSVTAAALALAKGRTADETALLGAVLTQLGDTLTTISIQKDIAEKNCKSQTENSK
ncbi:MAG: hypothetical protein FWE80_05325 [Oscillospiraceae bacterium]|nr:hypothetical protein [Oscillospiraceae bacterium]